MNHVLSNFFGLLTFSGVIGFPLYADDIVTEDWGWTPWYDTDDPADGCDDESLWGIRIWTEKLGMEVPCLKPRDIEVDLTPEYKKTYPNVTMRILGNRFRKIDAKRGLLCCNMDQNGSKCADYRVRLLCKTRSSRTRQRGNPERDRFDSRNTGTEDVPHEQITVMAAPKPRRYMNEIKTLHRIYGYLGIPIHKRSNLRRLMVYSQESVEHIIEEER